MKKTLKKVALIFVSFVSVIVILGLILAYLPSKSRISNHGISPEEAAILRLKYIGVHQQFTTTDGESLFLRRWNPDSIIQSKKDITVLIFHGFTAHSGAYDMAGVPLSAVGNNW